MYDYDLLGDYEEDFLLVCRTIDDSIKEFSGNMISKLEIKEEEGKVNYDNDQFIHILNSVHLVRTRSDTLKALFYDGFKLMAEEAAKNGKLQGTEPEGKEVVQDI